jgi:hypothetical protein
MVEGGLKGNVEDDEAGREAGGAQLIRGFYQEWCEVRQFRGVS